jgi:hypothetical protein
MMISLATLTSEGPARVGIVSSNPVGHHPTISFDSLRPCPFGPYLWKLSVGSVPCYYPLSRFYSSLHGNQAIPTSQDARNDLLTSQHSHNGYGRSFARSAPSSTILYKGSPQGTEVGYSAATSPTHVASTYSVCAFDDKDISSERGRHVQPSSLTPLSNETPRNDSLLSILSQRMHDTWSSTQIRSSWRSTTVHPSV